MSRFLIGFISLFALAAGCGDARTLYVDHYLQVCQGEALQLCMRTSPDGQSWSLFHGSIDRFTYRWGSEHRLLVDVRQVPDPPADGSSLAYHLIETLDTDAVTADARFSLQLDSRALTPHASGGFVLLLEKPIVCDRTAVCDDIAARLATPAPFIVDLRHPPRADDPLIAEAVR